MSLNIIVVTLLYYRMKEWISWMVFNEFKIKSSFIYKNNNNNLLPLVNFIFYHNNIFFFIYWVNRFRIGWLMSLIYIVKPNVDCFWEDECQVTHKCNLSLFDFEFKISNIKLCQGIYGFGNHILLDSVIHFFFFFAETEIEKIDSFSIIIRFLWHCGESVYLTDFSYSSCLAMHWNCGKV